MDCAVQTRAVQESTVGAALSASKHIKGKSNSNTAPSDGQAWEKVAICAYEYLRHVGAQKSAQTSLSVMSGEKKCRMVGREEPPGFLHSGGVYFRISTVWFQKDGKREHSSEAKASHDYSAAAAPKPVLGNTPQEVACSLVLDHQGAFNLFCHLDTLEVQGPYGGYLTRFLEVSQEISNYFQVQWTQLNNKDNQIWVSQCRE